ncbi:MAG: DUF6483 family protein [Acutalibacteraceae bacterium]
MFENDYILKQIEMSTKFLAKLIFGKESPEYKLQYDEIANAKPIDLLCLTLRRMIDEGEINEAENLLYENIEREARAEYLEIAIDFYDRLSKLSADRLDECDFSRAEIFEGLENVKKIYGIETT